ncbi:prophage tail fiber C-terminus family protein [Escherichia coli]|uniref:Prophage tail fiber C-terminus family protein n=1 Tax=Escherichia coli TaxID=562 RepID=A0A376UBT7_ECOLX|nr:prophage tail fiber C-terminus family protein [Escherichia coli]
MNILKKLMQRLCGCGKHDDRENGELLTAQLRLGPADILESMRMALSRSRTG